MVIACLRYVRPSLEYHFPSINKLETVLCYWCIVQSQAFIKLMKRSKNKHSSENHLSIGSNWQNLATPTLMYNHDDTFVRTWTHGIGTKYSSVKWFVIFCQMTKLMNVFHDESLELYGVECAHACMYSIVAGCYFCYPCLSLGLKSRHLWRIGGIWKW